MGFAAALSAEAAKNPAWKGLNMCFVTAQSPEVGVDVEASSVDVLKDACFGVEHAGEATSTILHDPSKSLYEFLGTEQFSIIGQLARFLSGYWIRMIAMSLIKYTPPFFFSKYAFGDPRVALGRLELAQPAAQPEHSRAHGEQRQQRREVADGHEEAEVAKVSGPAVGGGAHAESVGEEGAELGAEDAGAVEE